MTIKYFPKTEEERLELEEWQRILFAVMGTAVGPGLLLGGLDKYLEKAGHPE